MNTDNTNRDVLVIGGGMALSETLFQAVFDSVPPGNYDSSVVALNDDNCQAGPAEFNWAECKRTGNNKAHRPKRKRTAERKLKKQAQRRSKHK